MNRSLTRAVLRGLAILVVAADMADAQATPAAQRERCLRLVPGAQAKYSDGDLRAAIDLAKGCIDSTSSIASLASLRARAYGLMAKAHLALDHHDTLVRRAVESLLEENPYFDGNELEDSPRFLALVQKVRADLRRRATASVSKSDEPLSQVPATIQVITADQLRIRGYSDLEQALHDLPGFDISRPRGQSYSNIFQRGRRTEETNRTLVIVDGVESNDIFSNTAYISRQFPLSSIDRIEVVYGPASTMYGANAIQGVINIITKNPEEHLARRQSVGATARVDAGPWNTRIVDATVAAHVKDASFSLTARAYESDGWDGSSSWSFDRSSKAATALYEQALFGFADVVDSTQRAAAVASARALDAKAFQGTLNGRPVGYTDRARDWMVAAKFKLRDLQLGFQTWQLDEGTASAGTSRSMPGALNGNLWRPHQSAFSAGYSGRVSGVTVNYFGQARVHGIGDGSARYSLQGYLDGPFGLEELRRGQSAFWTSTQLRQSSTQVRNELNINFRPRPALLVVAGAELRNGSVQANYEQVTNCTRTPDWFEANGITTPSAARDSILKGVPEARSQLSDRIVKIMLGRSGTRCTQRDTAFNDNPLSPQGGNHYAVRDIGVFAQATYTLKTNTRLIAGYRVDNNVFKPVGGTGTVGNPRLAVVHTRGTNVFKVVYAEAFKAPSSAEQFSSVGGVRALATVPLKTERVRNLELSVGRQSRLWSVDASVYRANISEALGNVSSDFLVADRQVNDFITAYAKTRFTTIPVVPLTDELVKRLLFAPTATRSFRNLGGFTVTGVQVATTARHWGTDLFANYTFTHPYATGDLSFYAPVDSARARIQRALSSGQVTPFVPGALPTSIRIGDIASHRFNVGAERQWKRVEGSLRANAVGRRQVGAGTTVNANPLTSIDPYVILNGSVSYKFGGSLTAQLTGDNLLDARYYHPGNGVADGLRAASSVVQPGRALLLRLITKFP
jgi:outer membrane receptor for ferrienterochelin and colicin